MNFRRDPAKQAQELSFSGKVQMINHPPSFFNQNVAPQTSFEKLLEMFFGSRSNISEHLRTIFQKTNIAIRLLRKLQTFLLRVRLMAIYKSLIGRHLDYGDVRYVQTFKMLFQQKLEIIQYKVTLVIPGAISGFSKKKQYQELGSETLQQRLWCRKTCCFYKILKPQSPKYVYSIFLHIICHKKSRQCNKTPAINVKHNFFKKTFFFQ